MEAQIITIFCIIDDIVKSSGFIDNKQARMSRSEIMTIAISAGMFFAGNQERARLFLSEQGYVKIMLSKSQFNRRLHAIDGSVWEMVNHVLAQVFISQNDTQEYIVDSFPVEVCHAIRIKRCRIYTREEFRGKCARKKEFFFGVCVHMVVTKTGQPVKCVYAPGSHHDSRVFKSFQLDLPEGSTMYADSAYTDYKYEEVASHAHLRLLIARKSNSKQPHSPSRAYLITHIRRRIETTFSRITSLFPKTIHAVTPKGFQLKIFTFILA